MLTSRGAGLLLLVLLLWAYGLAAGIASVGLLGTALLLWFLLAWLVFLCRVRWARARLHVERVFSDDQGEVRRLWAGLSYQVKVRITQTGSLGLPYVVAIDRLPLLASKSDGRHHTSGTLPPGGELHIDYTLKPAAAGPLRFEGVRLLVSDLEGFFALPFFVRQEAVILCLPPLADVRGHVPAVKRVNILPLMGHHPHRRPGSGIELLELRDYLPGDPPKRIAWKISARRRRLMIRELESEVPVRCTIFMDISDVVRLGLSGRNPLSKMIEIAASLTQANAASRDLTGVVVFDESSVGSVVRPERGKRHLLELIRLLSDHAALLPRANAAPLSALVPLAYGVAQDLYPEMVSPYLNSFPWWLPLLSPRPDYTKPLPGRTPTTRVDRALAWMERRLRDSPLGWLQSLPRRFSVSAHRHYRQRKKLCALLASKYDLGACAAAQMLEDDETCRQAILRFLGEHQVPFAPRHFDEEGRSAFAAPEKPAVLARALLSSVHRGQDNELYVLLVDLLENTSLDPLLRAVRVARARHHQVVLICPWPEGTPLPPKQPDDSKRVAGLSALLESSPDMDAMLEQALTWRLHQAYDRLKRALGRAGVPIICARQRDAVDLILERMNRLRIALRGAP